MGQGTGNQDSLRASPAGDILGSCWRCPNTEQPVQCAAKAGWTSMPSDYFHIQDLTLWKSLWVDPQTELQRRSKHRCRTGTGDVDTADSEGEAKGIPLHPDETLCCCQLHWDGDNSALGKWWRRTHAD